MKDFADISKLGFGMMRLPMLNETDIDLETVKKMVDTFIASGCNYFDTAYVYHRGQSERIVKEALTSRYDRESYYLTTKLSMWTVNEKADMQKVLDDQLEKTGAGYFDVYLLHSVTKDKLEKCDDFDVWGFLRQTKERGIARHIGLSFHDTPELLDTILRNHPEMEIVQLQINYFDWENPRIQAKKCYEVARKHGKKVIVMEPVRGGLLANPDSEVKELFAALNPDASPSSYAIRFCASQEGVLCVLSGMSNMAQMQDNVSYMADFKPLSDKEAEAVAKAADIYYSKDFVPCTACRYCTDGCPMKINIPAFIDIHNSLKMFGNKEGNRKSYENTAKNGGKPSDCISCRMCESVCPQHISIPEEMKKCASVFEE